MKLPNSPIEKTNLHPRNRHRNGYDFSALTNVLPELSQYVITNPKQKQTIDFSNPNAVRTLNKALLLLHFGIEWDIPEHNLCPPIPGREDYIHYLADLLSASNNNVIPEGETVTGLDIGVGANCIYPILGNSIYGWSFVGTDTNNKALTNCVRILEKNPKLADAISLQHQANSRFIFKDIIAPEDRFAFTMCNPPFHASAEDAHAAATRKTKNLQLSNRLNFSGQNAELWCEGGEIRFITQMIYESAKYPMQCLWFTTLVSKAANLKHIYTTLNKVNAARVETIEMTQGQKTSRFVAWSFLSHQQQNQWNF